MQFMSIRISYSNRSLIKFSISCILIYLASTLLAIKLTNCSFNEFNLFNPAYNYSLIIHIFLNPIILISGAIIIIFIPGILLTTLLFKRELDFLDFLACSSMANIVLLILGGSLFKFITKGALNRFNFIMFIIASTIIIALLSIIKFKNKVIKNAFTFKFNFMKVAIFSIIILSCLFLLHKHFDGAPLNLDFSETSLLKIPLGQQSDELEITGITESLKTHLFPYWDLEYVDKMGFHVLNPPLGFFFFLHFTLLFGNSYVPYTTILLFSIIIILIINFQVSQIQIYSQNKFYIILLPIYISFSLFLSSSEGLLLISSGIILGLLYLFLHYYFLIIRKYTISLIFAGMSFMIRYECLFFVCIGLIFFRGLFKEEWKKSKYFFKNYLYFVLLFLTFIAILGLLGGNMATYFKSIFIERFARFDYFNFIENLFSEQRGLWPSFDFYDTLVLIRQLLISSCFLVIVLFLPKKDRISKLFSGIGITYFFFILASVYSREHYIIPLVIITALVTPRYLYNLSLMLKEKFSF